MKKLCLIFFFIPLASFSQCNVSFGDNISQVRYLRPIVESYLSTALTILGDTTKQSIQLYSDSSRSSTIKVFTRAGKVTSISIRGNADKIKLLFDDFFTKEVSQCPGFKQANQYIKFGNTLIYWENIGISQRSIIIERSNIDN